MQDNCITYTMVHSIFKVGAQLEQKENNMAWTDEFGWRGYSKGKKIKTRKFKLNKKKPYVHMNFKSETANKTLLMLGLIGKI